MRRWWPKIFGGGLLTGCVLTAAVMAQDGPLLPGLDSATRESSSVSEAPASGAAEPSIWDDYDIRPLDENGLPQVGPAPSKTLNLPDPPSLDSNQQESDTQQPQRKTLWQKSTDAIRGLTKPSPAADPQHTSDAIRNWQMLRQQQKSSPRVTPPKPQISLPPPPAIGVEAKKPTYQQPTSRRRNQTTVPQVPSVPSQATPPVAAEPGQATDDNTPRSPWERAIPQRWRAQPSAKRSAAPSRSTTYSKRRRP